MNEAERVELRDEAAILSGQAVQLRESRVALARQLNQAAEERILMAEGLRKAADGLMDEAKKLLALAREQLEGLEP